MSLTRWIAAAAALIVGTVLLGNAALLLAVPVILVTAVVGTIYGLQTQGIETPMTTARTQLLRGDVDAAAGSASALLTARSTTTRRRAADLVALAADAGSDDPRILELLPRLDGLGTVHHLGRALTTQGMIDEAVTILMPASRSDAVVWAQLVATLAAGGRFAEMTDAIRGVSGAPTLAAILTTSRRISDVATLDALRAAYAGRLGDTHPGVVGLDMRLGRGESAVARLAAANAGGDNHSLFWTAWAEAVSEVPGAIEQLVETIGRWRDALEIVPALQMLAETGHPRVVIGAGPVALATVRPGWRPGLHFALARAHLELGGIEQAIEHLVGMPPDLALAVATTPPFAPGIRQGRSYERLIAHAAAV